ncbi:HK97 gp10 family phage protein [Paenibacillus polymyxa]|uniref:HK97 gp10 family phage protein n=1 Tax=Paenibacillus TaxID=44249 RepID=UPI002024ED5D|nr:HK97 gp10 family phage protein [Paenibacillus polymyxa]URJ42149.3 HK97 gp10 family phage protein [Paenibacillus polymyxa]
MSFAEFDFSEFEQLSKSLRKMQADYPHFVENCIRELASRLLAKTVARTPVDTGMLRRNWQLGPVERVGGGYSIELFNPIEYAPYVEYGHRTRLHTGWVEGRFMLTISERELERELPALMDRKLKRFIEDHLR